MEKMSCLLQKLHYFSI